MHFVKFTGLPQNIARFGMVKTGAVLKVTLAEYASLQGNPDFETPELDEFPVEEVPAAPDKPVKFPKKFDGFDLKTIPWDGVEFLKKLSKYPKPDLLKILRGMKALGIKVVANPDWTKEILADSVASAGISAGWVPVPGQLHVPPETEGDDKAGLLKKEPDLATA